MLVLFDHGAPRGLARSLVGHTVKEARAQGWGTFRNGELLEAAEAAGFDVLLTTRQEHRYQQNLAARKIALIVLGNPAWPVVRLSIERVVAAVNAATTGSHAEVDIG